MENQNNKLQALINEMLRSFQFMLEDAVKLRTTKVYDGLIVGQGTADGTWQIRVNGEVHAIKQYGNITTPAVNKMVKVVIPQGNMSIAFFM